MPRHEPLPAFAAWAGPRQPKVLVVGEAFGGDEASLRRPFVGSAGREFWLMLGEAAPDLAPELHSRATALHRYGAGAWVRERELWLEATGMAFTNVLNFQPPENKIEALCGTKVEVGGANYPLSAIAHGKYLRPEYLGELERLRVEIHSSNPNLIIAAGNTACWALLQTTNISAIRGTIREARVPESGGGARAYKLLPVFHPASVLYQWAMRPVLVADLLKARREWENREISRPARSVLVDPSEAEVRAWVSETLAGGFEHLAVDIETRAGQITCIGFARSASEALVVPFWLPMRANGPGADPSYWPNAAAEVAVWNEVDRLLSSDIPKIFQNGAYDLQYILRMGLRPRACLADTMLLHHSHFPELRKGLGFLGSIYTNEPAWKLMRTAKPDTEKRDE